MALFTSLVTIPRFRGLFRPSWIIFAVFSLSSVSLNAFQVNLRFLSWRRSSIIKPLDLDKAFNPCPLLMASPQVQSDENTRPNNRRRYKSNAQKTTRNRRIPPRMTKSPEQVESQLKKALEGKTPVFPTVRECNAALAAIGDAGELLRALRLFGRMRKAERLYPIVAPAPTLVTYSTLMSRAVKLHKSTVALRLWELMVKSDGISRRDIDLKAANIRMNCFAKMANVTAAQELLEQMKSGQGPDVPQLVPNLVTYNTLLHACHQAGDLDSALATAQQIHRPDARTYTSLIATVARKTSDAAGRNDPTLGFRLLQEMQDRGVRPNGMTYCALIDACGRCQRSDLALQGLRIMLRQKADNGDVPLANEVGAWTAAINACGKAGRWNTANKLFHAMEGFGVQANAITCGSLTDSLLRAGRTAETLQVLRFMKANNIVPSEVMYTSLMMRAEGLVQMEEEAWMRNQVEDSNDAKAVDVYTELMKSLTDIPQLQQRGDHDPKSLLIKVFLVFQQMKAAGAKPDAACFNALLRACARAGDWEHAQDVLRQMKAAKLDPNDVSWRQLLRTAANLKRSDLAEDAWRQGLSYNRPVQRLRDSPLQRWKPSVASFGSFISAYVGEAERQSDQQRRRKLYEQAVSYYLDVGRRNSDMALDRMNRRVLQESPRAMLIILRAVVSLRELVEVEPKLDEMISSILKLECLQDIQSTRLGWKVKDTLYRAQKLSST